MMITHPPRGEKDESNCVTPGSMKWDAYPPGEPQSWPGCPGWNFCWAWSDIGCSHFSMSFRSWKRLIT